MTKEQEGILKRCMDIFNGWVVEEAEKSFEKTITNYNVQPTNGNYLDAYPIVAAWLLDNASQMLNGSSFERTIREQKRLAHKYMNHRLSV